MPLLTLWQQQLQQVDRRVERLGNLETTPIWFEGQPLFTIASPTVWDRSQPGSQLPVELRANQIEDNLNRVVEGSFIPGSRDGILTNFDPKTLQVSIVSLSEVPVVVAGDAYHTQPLKLITVTHIDADYNGQPIAALAEQWRSIIYQNLYAALMERSPDALSLQGRLGESLVVLAVMLAASLVLWLLQAPLKRRNRSLRRQQATIVAETAPTGDFADDPSAWAQFQDHFLARFQQQAQLQQQRHLLAGFRWVLSWAQVAVWIAGLSTALILFPWTKPLGWWLLGMPTTLLFIWFLTSWGNRLARDFLQGTTTLWVKFGVAATPEAERDSLRVYSLLSLLLPIKTLLITTIGIVAMLVYLGMPFSLVLTIVGVIALILLLIGQNFMRDWMAGLFILWEDQYAIGDVVAIDHQTGLVERMTLRLTQLRNLEGHWISIANGRISQAVNLSQRWRRERQKANLEAVPDPTALTELPLLKNSPDQECH
jgi:small conductance mechanosensitive channel